MLTVGPLRVFLRKRGDLHHAAVFGFPTQPTQNRPLEQLRIQPIRFRPPRLARHCNAGGMDDVNLDPLIPQPARQPETVAPSFECHHHPLDLAARFDGLVSPAMKQLQKRVAIGALLLHGVAS